MTGEATYERAVANAACQLAQALRDGARRSEADGVAVEAIALAPPWSEERARLLVVRATIASDRRAFDNAHTLLDEATTIASDLPDAGRLEGRIENTRATVLAVSGKLPRRATRTCPRRRSSRPRRPTRPAWTRPRCS